MLDVSGPEFAGCDCVVEKGWHFGGYLFENVLWWVDGKIGKVLFGEVDD